MNLKKKIITSLGIAVMVMSVFFNMNVTNSSSGDLDLASLLNINTANAETGWPSSNCRATESINDTCYDPLYNVLIINCVVVTVPYRINCSFS
ncbi:hypothetical protein [Snuella lapsa]|uniref:Secreted protein n=1 Tax=Snuella lapsa TaxID=870481 RepID=A0ABP6X523_9FLAO